ncbi:MAG TPA: pyridoxal phosphate-dependent aminotransferase [Vicinamibacterales bacterium]|nr:pyridoxal phosphate-dependent aminotransferase [Vicinamibacterales bacterium]
MVRRPFSSRVPADLGVNRLAQAIQDARTRGQQLIDLTLSNPTRAGFVYPSDLLLPLAHPRGVTYQPQPLGLLEARRAVSADYARRGVTVSADRIVLTSSTSEAYSLLFKLLTDTGDEVLVPRPSYPLFDHLTQLDAVTARPYDLEYHDGWTVDLSSVDRALSERTRALLVVSPNNPTGSFVSRQELKRLTAMCAERGVAIIADEVFADYQTRPGACVDSGRTMEVGEGLVFSLGGLSKSAGLPQVKLGWMALAGAESLVGAALERLELICDTYLSVSTPVQAAAAELLACGAAIRRQIQTRIASNYRMLAERVEAVPACSLLAADGGWYAVVQVPSIDSEEDLVVSLVDDGVVVYPGYFFDFPRESYVVVSLLPPEHEFDEGVTTVLRHIERSL